MAPQRCEQVLRDANLWGRQAGVYGRLLGGLQRRQIVWLPRGQLCLEGRGKVHDALHLPTCFSPQLLNGFPYLECRESREM